MTVPTERTMKITGIIFQVTLTILATLIYGTLTEVKNQSKEVVNEFREYQKAMDKRVMRIEFTLYGDGMGNKGFSNGQK